MRELFLTVLEISILMSGVIFLLILMSPVLKKRYLAKWRFLALITVALRLFVPIHISLPNAPIQLNWLEWHKPQTTVGDKMPLSQKMGQGNQHTATWEYSSPVEHSAAMVVSSSVDTSQYPRQRSVFDTVQCLVILWLFGMGVVLLWKLTSLFCFYRHFTQCGRPANEQASQAVLEKLKTEQNIKTPIRLFVCPFIGPMMIGLFHPIIILPKEERQLETDPVALPFILRHELLHYKRRDILFQYILLLVCAVHWFNPFVWWLVSSARRDMEFACDDAVVREMDVEMRAKYGESIMASVKYCCTVSLSTGLRGSSRAMEARLNNLVASEKRKNGPIFVVTLILIIGLFDSCITFA